MWGFWQEYNFPGMEETSLVRERNLDQSLMQRDGISIWALQNPFKKQSGFVLETHWERCIFLVPCCACDSSVPPHPSGLGCCCCCQ